MTSCPFPDFAGKYKIRKNKLRQYGDSPVTICIAAICDNDGAKEPKVVMAGDRMVTYGHTRQFEHRAPKLIELAPNCVVATAGNVTTPVEILEDAGYNIRMKDPVQNIGLIGDNLLKSFHKIRERDIENLILKPNLIHSSEDYLKNQQNYRQEFYDEIDDEISDFKFNVSIIIAGIDDNGAQLYKIEDGYEKLEPLTPLGYTWNGIGAIYAREIFFSSEYYDKTPLNEAIYTVYKAKKLAEHAPGVGEKYIDLWIITKSKIEKVDDEMMKLLVEMYKKEQNAIKRSVKFTTLDNSIKKLKL